MRQLSNDKKREQTFWDHFALECMSWLRELDFFLMEVSLMKTRLSHLVDAATERSIINKAEEFVIRLMDYEERIRQIYNEIKSHESKGGNGPVIKQTDANKYKIMEDHAHLRSAMAEMSSIFLELRIQFNQWMEDEMREI